MSTLRRACAFAVIGLITGVTPVGAQPAAPAPEPELPRVAVTFSPVHLILPVVELTGELRVQPKVGVAAILGFGTVDITGSDATATVFEVGASGRYYVLGNFRTGLQLGGEVLYIGASAADGQTTATATGLSIGGFVGYKWTASFGLTLEAQVGASTYAVRAESSTGDSNDESAVSLLLNLNIGWSF